MQRNKNNPPRQWLPFSLKALGTLYLLEAPLLLVMRAIVLMFVPSKSAWTDEFQGFENRTWSVVLLLAAGAFFCSGVACWLAGVWLRRGRPQAERFCRHLSGWLVIMQCTWLVWVFLTHDRFLLFHLCQALGVLSLGLSTWFGLRKAPLGQ